MEFREELDEVTVSENGAEGEASLGLLVPSIPLGSHTFFWMYRVSRYREQVFRSGLTSALQALSHPSFPSDAAAVPMCPPAALEVGVELLCRLFELWGQMGAGVLVLMQWLLGEEDEDEGPDEASSLVSVLQESYSLFSLFKRVLLKSALIRMKRTSCSRRVIGTCGPSRCCG